MKGLFFFRIRRSSGRVPRVRKGKLGLGPFTNRKRESNRERDREKERERKAIFSLRFTGFHRSDLVRSRVKAYLRDEGYVWVPESQDSAKVQGSGFHGN